MDNHQPELFKNPITMAFNILDSYRNIVDQNLIHYIPDAKLRNQILDSLEIDRGVYFSLNRAYKQSSEYTIDFLKKMGISPELGRKMPGIKHLFIHQERAIQAILNGKNTVLSTGTGSGKTESFLIPIIDYCLKHKDEEGIKALIIYPMNALANDQLKRLGKYTRDLDVKYGVYVGTTPYKLDENNQQNREYPNQLKSRQEILENSPDILVTNYVMLDWLLTGKDTYQLFTRSPKSLHYIVLDELHIYRGNKATHLKYLLRRLKYFLKREVIHIGTSATLSQGLQKDNIQDGYLPRDEEKITEFITNLWDIDHDSYEFIEPEYEPIQSESPIPINITPEIEGGWKLQTNQEIGINNINQLTQEQFREWDLGEEVSSSRIFKRLENDGFIQELKKKLSEQPMCFTEINSLLNQVKTTYPEELTKAYLSAISFLNYMSSKPILDFRIHLFIKNLDGYLKRCIKCGKFHTGTKDACLDCGFPLFYVYQKNINKMIGKVSGKFLRNTLEPEEDDPPGTYYVFISKFTQTPETEILSFDDESPILDGNILLDYADYGKLNLELIMHNDSLLLVRSENYKIIAGDYLIPLVDPRKDYKYLEQLVKKVLLFHRGDSEQKILAFIDSREKASQYASVLQDEFIEEFFIEYLKFILPEESRLPILTILEFAKKDIERRQENLSEFEKKVFAEFELWFWRYLSMPPRIFQNIAERLRIDGYQGLCDAEKRIVNIFLNERIIAKPQSFINKRINPSFIKFFLGFARMQRGISIKPEQVVREPNFPNYISLGEQARIYSVLQELKLTPDKLERLFDSLCQKKILIKGYWVNKQIIFDDNSSEKHFLYYLNPDNITWQIPTSRYKDYTQIRENYLFRVAVHSADVDSQQRKKIEDDFSDSNIHFLISTPTLEMGIDIGRLTNVMMIGVPPLPSNYAQRAGRAGRESGNNYALIVNICGLIRNKLNHDEYYFNHPRQMIKGLISPPSFNPYNKEVIQKHINAFLYTWLNINKDFNDPNEIMRASISEIQQVFNGKALDNEFFQKCIQDFLQEYYSKQRKNISRKKWYKSTFFPDYSFNREMVYLIDYQKLQEKKQEDVYLDDIAIASYEIENAITKFIPGEQIFAAGKIYKILPEGEYRSQKRDNDVELREYHSFYAHRENNYTQKEIKRKCSIEKFCYLKNPTFKEIGGILEIAYTPNSRLEFINNDVFRDIGKEISQYHNGGQFQIGYFLQREILACFLDTKIAADGTYQISFASALDRAIKDYYGLDEGEVKIEMNVSISWKDIFSASEDDPEKKERGIIFYDSSGNGNIPFKRIFEEIEKVLQITYDNIKNCCNPECKNGCYLCIRTYQTQFFAERAQKEIALMIFGYLSGDEKVKFKPKIAKPSQKVAEYDLVFYLETKEAKIKTTNNLDGYPLPQNITNEELFESLANIIRKEYTPEIKTLRIIGDNESLIKRIEGVNIRAGKETFARFQFQLLRFKHVEIKITEEVL